MKTITELDQNALREFCSRRPIQKLELFGSALRKDFSAGSDLDFLVEYTPGARVTLMDEAEMVEELEAICGRHVDLLSRRAVEESPNQIRREAILSNVREVYVAPR